MAVPDARARERQRRGGDGRDAGAEGDSEEVDQPSIETSSPPTKWRSATGTTAANAAAPRNGIVRLGTPLVSALSARC
jgi:hypothetical protein